MTPTDEFAASKVAAEAGRSTAELDCRATALRALTDAGVPFVVAGAYAFFEYTGVFRDTKDLDLFIRERDLDPAFRALEAVGFRTELTDPAWIGKAFQGEYFVDLIFSSGNGVAIVDDAWFENARRARVMGVDVLVAPPEEIIWSKGFVVERERYDGADVNHILHACAEQMDWRRLLDRFDRYHEVLFSHVLLYRFVYPSERSRVPEWVIEELVARTLAQLETGDHPQAICRGNLLSRVQYQHDYDHHGYEDGRLWDELDRSARRGTEGGSVAERDVSPGGGG
jgi:hypothetical protein